jgi:hypothetical protein
MKKRIKVIIGISLITLLAFALLITVSLYTLDIEDHYGDLQNVYYKSESGDVVIDENKRVGFIYKISNRIFIDENDCLQDVNSWAYSGQQPVKLEVYRLDFNGTLIDYPTYQEIQDKIRRKKLKPIVTSY